MFTAHRFSSLGSSRRRFRGFFTGLAAWWLLAGAAGWPPLAHADSDHDHDRARAALQAGQVLPLKTVLERLERTQPGQVLEVELEQESGVWVYEIKLLKPGGQLVRLALDARSAEPVGSRERHRSRASGGRQ